MDNRVLIAVVLSLLGLMVYQQFVLKRLYPPPAEHRLSKPATPPIPDSAKARTGTQPESPPSTTTQIPATPAVASGPTVEVANDLFEASFTTRGARLKSFKLKRFRASGAPDSPALEMINPAPSGDLPMGVVLHREDSIYEDSALLYTFSGTPKVEIHNGERASVVFSGTTPDGVVITKQVSFSGSEYPFGIQISTSGQTAGIQSVGLEMSQPLTPHKGYADIPQIQARVAKKTLVEGEKALRKGVEPASGDIDYAGFGDRYFLSVFLPKTPQAGTLAMNFDGEQARAELMYPAAPGGTSLTVQAYLGPKQIDILEQVNPELGRAIDFGWTGILALAFLRALKLFHRIAPNYGVDIILLTVGIRILFLPMSIKSQRSMMRLQRLQPQVERIRDRFKDDRERLNKEMVDLYRRNHVNPLGGCAPMALQLPIFIGLYQALMNAVELRHSPFAGWITDLSAPDCLTIPHMPVLPFTECGGIPVLVLLMGASTFLQQWMSPQPADPNQQRMMMLMPLMFIVMFVNFPAGLSLYYFASNMLGILQQYFLNREFKQLSPVSA